jgi:hypothetical protein
MGTHNEAIGFETQTAIREGRPSGFIFLGGPSHLIAKSSLDKEKYCG